VPGTASSPGIGFRGLPGRAAVIGTGLDVWEVVDLLGSFAGDVGKILASYPLSTGAARMRA
jgi:hypothetical protein